MVFNPHDKRRQLWDVLMLLAAVFSAVEVPVWVTMDLVVPKWVLLIEGLTSLLFMVDIGLHYSTSYWVGHKHITDLHLIRRRYLKSWFWIDLVSALPLPLICALLEKAFPILRWLALLRLLRLSRIAGFLGQLSKKNIINPSLLRLTTLVFWLLLGSHLTACMWFYLGAGNAAGSNAGYEATDNVRNYIRALYWTVTTVVTIGYGDISPQDNVQTIFTMFIQLLGAGMYGYLIGNLASLVTNMDVARARFQEKTERLNIFMKSHAIPDELQDKARNYYDYLWETRKGFDETSVINELPPPLRVELSLFLNRHLIEKVPLFKDARPDLIRDIVMNLQHIVYSPGDFVVNKGDVGTEMYFISRGIVEVVGDDLKTVVASLSDGSFFGEIALLMSIPRTATLRAADYCDLYMLEKPTFDRILNKYPDFKTHIQKYAEERARALKH